MSVNRLILRPTAFPTLKITPRKKDGTYLTDYRVSLVKKECTKDLASLGRVHEKKLRELTPLLVPSTSDQSTTAIMSRFPGSLKISANGYTTESFPAKEKHRIRPHRRLNRKAKEKRKRIVTSPARKHDYVPTKEDVERFDPIVLTDKVKLSQEQISICRLPDCFAPNPRTPIDVLDQVIGTHQWAERLRWHRFHKMKKREDGEDVSTLPDQEVLKKNALVQAHLQGST